MPSMDKKQHQLNSPKQFGSHLHMLSAHICIHLRLRWLTSIILRQADLSKLRGSWICSWLCRAAVAIVAPSSVESCGCRFALYHRNIHKASTKQQQNQQIINIDCEQDVYVFAIVCVGPALMIFRQCVANRSLRAVTPSAYAAFSSVEDAIAHWLFAVYCELASLLCTTVVFCARSPALGQLHDCKIAVQTASLIRIAVCSGVAKAVSSCV